MKQPYYQNRLEEKFKMIHLSGLTLRKKYQRVKEIFQMVATEALGSKFYNKQNDWWQEELRENIDFKKTISRMDGKAGSEKLGQICPTERGK